MRLQCTERSDHRWWPSALSLQRHPPSKCPRMMASLVMSSRSTNVTCHCDTRLPSCTSPPKNSRHLSLQRKGVVRQTTDDFGRNTRRCHIIRAGISKTRSVHTASSKEPAATTSLDAKIGNFSHHSDNFLVSGNHADTQFVDALRTNSLSRSWRLGNWWKKLSRYCSWAIPFDEDASWKVASRLSTMPTTDIRSSRKNTGVRLEALTKEHAPAWDVGTSRWMVSTSTWPLQPRSTHGVRASRHQLGQWTTTVAGVCRHRLP